MTVVDLHRLGLPLALQEIPESLAEPGRIGAERLEVQADLTELYDLVDELRDLGEAGTNTQRAGWDSVVAEPLHSALRGVFSRRQAVDPRVWQWMSIATHLREYIWLRWHGLVSSDPVSALADDESVARRFHATASLAGLARNGLARLYWTIETLAEGADLERAHRLADRVLTNTDLHLNIFEREVGLHPPAARAAVEVLSDVSEDEHRAALKRLNRIATTTVLEQMTEKEVGDILQGR